MASENHRVKKPRLDENLITCVVCKELIKSSKILNCGHTFCQKCLEDWAEANRGSELTCPNCRQPWQVPEGGVEQLPSNYHVNNMVDFFLTSQKLDTDSIANKCEFCEITEASLACVECRQVACDICAKVHARTKATAKHLVLDLEEYIAYKDQPPKLLEQNECVQHPGIQLKFYCQTCSVSTCAECILTEHPDHSHVSLAKAAWDTRNSLEATRIKVADRLNYFDEKEANIREVQEKLIDSKQQAILQVEKRTENLVKEIRDKGEESIKAINDVCEEKSKILDSQLDDIALAKDKVKTSFGYFKSSVEEKSNEELMLDSQKTMDKLDGLLKENIAADPSVNYNIQYSPHPEFVIGVPGIVGNHKAVACKSYLNYKGPKSPYLPMNMKTTLKLVTCDIGGDEIKQRGAEVTAEVILEGEKIACNITDKRDGNYAITFTPTETGNLSFSVFLFGQLVDNRPTLFKVVPKPSLPLKIVKFPGSTTFNRSSKVAVSKSKVFVTNSENYEIQVFDINGQYERNFTVTVEGERVKPKTVTFTRDNHLVITDKEGRICVCDSYGTLLRIFGGQSMPTSCMGGITFFSSRPKAPTYATAARSKEQIHLAFGNCVETYTTAGKLVEIINVENNILGVAVNSIDQIIVSYENNEVQVFSSNGSSMFNFNKSVNNHLSQSGVHRSLSGVHRSQSGVHRSQSGVTVDQYDNIIICYRSCLQMFSPRGDYIGRVDNPKDGTIDPFDVATVPGQQLKLVVTNSDQNNPPSFYVNWQ